MITIGTPLRLLTVEDSPDDAELVVLALQKGGFEVTSKRVQAAEPLREILKSEKWDVIVSDFAMPGFTALDALAVLKSTEIDIPFIVVSGTVGEETAVMAMRAGAHDYLMKGNLMRLAPVVQRELQDAEERRKKREVEEELQKTSEQLLQSQKMEAIGSLAGGIAHDFNNVLGSIILLCDAAVDDLGKPELVRKYLSDIGHSAEHASLLTKQLLTYSRKNALEPRVLDLNDEIADIESMLRRTIGENIQVSIEKDPLAKNIFFDRTQVNQMIMNLAVNARDAMPRGGKLTIATRAEELTKRKLSVNGTLPFGLYTVLSVRDTGCGMNETTMSRIFEPFFTTKGIGKGTGLGLSTVYGIVKQNSSFICVNSEVGRGTEFEIFMPAVELPREETDDVLIPQDTTGKETILVVEDQAALGTSISTALKRKGYQILSADSGKQALAILEERGGQVDLIITDVVMPEMSGTELVSKAHARWPNLKVIYMSGYLDDMVRANGLEQIRPEFFIEKPFNSVALLQKVRTTLDDGK